MTETKYLVIDPKTRTIEVPDSEKLLGVEFDEKAVRKYFECPKIVGDGIDLSQSSVYINVQNASGNESGKDRYPVENFKISGDVVNFEWQPERKVTARSGGVAFNVCVMTEDGREWNTTPTEGNVLKGLELLTPQELDTRGADYLGALTADVTANPETILFGRTAYVDGKKVAGSYVPLDTSDGTARAEDMADGVIAYVDGRKVVGNLTDSGDLKISTGTPYFTASEALGIKMGFIQTDVSIVPKNDIEKMILNGTRSITIAMSAIDFGNASASSVLKGKTFTSVNGLKQAGTMEKGSTVKTGSFNGKGLQNVEIDTGLSNIEQFVFFLSGTAQAGKITFGVSEVYYDGTYKRGSSYAENGTYIDNTIGTLTVSGGTVKYAPDMNDERTYTHGKGIFKWIAIGS